MEAWDPTSRKMQLLGCSPEWSFFIWLVVFWWLVVFFKVPPSDANMEPRVENHLYTAPLLSCPYERLYCQ